MTPERRIFLWVVVFVCLGIILYLLSSAILPFVAGMAVAYLLDPVADRLESRGVPRTAASLLIVGGFILIFIIILVALLPTVIEQVTQFVASVPDLIRGVSAEAQALLRRIRGGLTAAQQQEVNAALSQATGKLAGWLGDMAGRVLSGGAAILNLLSVLFIMPIVAFYLLRDWDRIVAMLDGLIPHTGGEAIRTILADIDNRLSGFVRGQAIVCLLLGIWYAGGLTLLGLNFGLVVGLAAGILTIIPFVGNIVGFGTSMAIAFTQFDGWLKPALVAAVFISGQFLEGNFVTPKVLGDRVGLHPVWLLFAVMAGSALLGITGALIAVPAAAAIAVVVRFLVQQYRESALYRAPPPGEAFVTSGPMSVTITPSGPAAEETETTAAPADAGPPAHV